MKAPGLQNKLYNMKRLPLLILILFIQLALINAQSVKKGKYGDGPDSIAPVGIVKGLSDEQLLETVQRQLSDSSGMAHTLIVVWRWKEVILFLQNTIGIISMKPGMNPTSVKHLLVLMLVLSAVLALVS